MVSGMKMLVHGMDSRLGIADSVWGSGKVSAQIGRQRQQVKGEKLNRDLVAHGKASNGHGM